ncbi:MAG: ABC transporter substrate-binding protein [Nitriliruptoraceae bacterium]
MSVLLLAACGEDTADPEAGEFAGETVRVLGGFTDPANDAFLEAVEGFEEETGATVEYQGSADFEQLIRSRVEGGNPPDVGMIPQPGLLQQFVSQEQVRPLDDIVDTGQLEETLIPGLFEIGTYDGQYYGLPRVIALKSSVWYPPQAFEEAGYEIPATFEELEELTERIAAEGDAAPWCLGIESGGSSGWVITDWIEDILLRTSGPEVYEDWVEGDVGFSSSEVMEAARRFEDLLLSEGHTFGGRGAILSTPYGDAPTPMFAEEPDCLLHRQASFISGFFPDGIVEGEDIDVFYLPPMQDDGFDGSPVNGSGDLAALFTDNPAAEEFMRYMSDPEWLGPQIDTGFDFSPHQTFPIEEYPSAAQRAQAEYLRDADMFAFDASDRMPADVGAGTFWSQMVSWINEEQTLEEAMEEIDESWPES